MATVGFVFALFVSLLCFCSLQPFVLLVSFLFNALFLGSSLFSALAQEREKRTIDALRLTQLSSLEILLYKSHSEMKWWRRCNTVFLLTGLVAAWWAGSPLSWALVGSAVMAAAGLFSISLALAVSTRSETTSSAVVNGWITKGVWLVGLPILDYVVEAVLVLNRDLHFLSYLDPAWTFHKLVNATLYETGQWSLVPLAIGAVMSFLLARLMLVQSSRLIDSSFESAATLEDRNRHSVYRKRFAFGLEKNPFMVRELAWQMRSGAGAWPGYAVFVTLFLAPLLYGVAQQGKSRDLEPVKVVRESVTVAKKDVSVQDGAKKPWNSYTRSYYHDHNSYMEIVDGPQVELRCHDGLCLSQMMGLPVNTGQHKLRDIRRFLVKRPDGSVTAATDREMEAVLAPSEPPSASRYFNSNNVQKRLSAELDRGLLTGLVLTILYLFIRGAAFMSGAVTGERERRAWDQLALTGVSPETYLNGKLFGVLYYPMRQLLLTSPLLLLFAVVGETSIAEMLFVIPLLVVTFVAAAGIGLLGSSTEQTSHQAQGKALVLVLAVMLVPMMPGSWVLTVLATLYALQGTRATVMDKAAASMCAGVWVALCGASASPLASVMKVCNEFGFGPLDASKGLPAGPSLMVSLISMICVAAISYRMAVQTMSDGGSVKA